MNLISYPYPSSSYLEDAIDEEYYSSINGILGEGESAIINDNMWVGSLIELSGTKGYWFDVNQDIELVFNPPLSDSSLVRQQFKKKSIPNEFKHTQSTQQAFYFVESAEINNAPLTTDDLIIAYNHNQIIGSRYWSGDITDVPAMGSDDSSLLEFYPKEGDNITFKVLDASTNTLIDMQAEGNTTWKNLGLSMIRLSDIIIPDTYALKSAYPNPFNPITTIEFGIPAESLVSLSIFDLQGRKIETLVDSNMKAGYHSIHWNATAYSSGIYFVKMVSGKYINTQKLMLIK